MRLGTSRPPALVTRVAQHRQAVLACAVVAPGAAALGAAMVLAQVAPDLVPDVLVQAQAVPVAAWLLALAVLAGAFASLPAGRADEPSAGRSRLSLSTTFTVALLVTGPLALALVVGAAASAAHELNRRSSLRHLAAAVVQFVVAAVCARLVFAALAGAGVLEPYRPLAAEHLAACMAAGLTYLLVELAPLPTRRDPATAPRPREVLVFRLEMCAVLLASAPVAAVMAQTSPWLLLCVTLPVLVVRRSAAVAASQQARALRDPLTGLGNREMFVRRADRLVGLQEGTGEPLAVLMVDLDHFKEINDNLGHHVGDKVIEAVGRRLAHAGGRHGCVARLGGDEFALAVPGIDPEEAGVFAQGLLADLARPLQIGGTRMVVQASVGIAMADGRTDLARLVQQADSALYRAKQGRARWCRYDPSASTDDAPRRLDLVTDLRAALDSGALGVRLEPAVCIGDGAVTGVAAHVYWRHPEHGPVPVPDVLAAADTAGLTDVVGEVVLDHALAAAALWVQDGTPRPVVVSIPDRQLCDLALPDRLRQALARHRVPSSLLVVQVGARALRGRPAPTTRVLRDLGRQGVRVRLAGFGTGGCDLGVLPGLHLDEIEVDPSFVDALAGRSESADPTDVLARTVVELGHRLGLKVVATGVADERQLDILGELGCQSAQGPVVAPAMGLAELTVWVRERADADSVLIDLDTWSAPSPPAGRS